MNQEDRDRRAEEEEMVGSLERDQLVSDRRHALARASLSGRSQAVLWALRIFVLIVGAMVIYTFCAQL